MIRDIKQLGNCSSIHRCVHNTDMTKLLYLFGNFSVPNRCDQLSFTWTTFSSHSSKAFNLTGEKPLFSKDFHNRQQGIPRHPRYGCNILLNHFFGEVIISGSSHSCEFPSLRLDKAQFGHCPVFKCFLGCWIKKIRFYLRQSPLIQNSFGKINFLVFFS